MCGAGNILTPLAIVKGDEKVIAPNAAAPGQGGIFPFRRPQSQPFEEYPEFSGVSQAIPVL